MNRNLLNWLLAVSLALNIGVLATYVYLRHQERASPEERAQMKPFREMWGPLNLEPGQQQALRGLLPEHRRRMRELRRELAQKRRELCDLARLGTAAWPDIREKIGSISTLQGQLEEEVLRFCLTFQEHLNPKQKTAFFASMERLMVHAQGGKGRMGPKWRKDMGGGHPGLPGPAAPQ